MLCWIVVSPNINKKHKATEASELVNEELALKSLWIGKMKRNMAGYPSEFPDWI